MYKRSSSCAIFQGNFHCSKSIVISADEEVTVELGKRRSQKDEMVEVSFDGDSKVRLEVGDRFVVRRAEDTF